ncbi:MAG: hypothetical protein PHG08_05835 [Bacilli bacterium]|jgi:hypothetical protein|nr:hypothetical protein [Bacilli bacterium]HON64532.1 hypothetical protein [Bacilli bacterium]HRS30433.1 hypothetical protein [Bacilli bacterium]HRU49676.1 hypothetical protein [Bacilli bacterium]
MKRIAHRLVVMVLFICLTIVFSVSVSYAWFVRTEYTNPVIINTGSLIASATLCRETETGFVEVTNTGYEFKDIVPGHQFNFKISITNEGTVSGILKLMVGQITGDLEAADILSLVFVDPSSETDEATELKLSEILEDGNNSVLFSGYVLGPSETLDFEFSLRVENTSLDIYQGKQISISRYTIHLVQIGAPE